MNYLRTYVKKSYMYSFKDLMILCLFSGLRCSVIMAQSAEAYESEHLRIIKVTPQSFIHVSWLLTESYGRVASNGLVYIDDGEAIVFDTPVNDTAATELIYWIQNKMNSRIKVVVPGHFHDDCLGGLKAFHEAGIISYAHVRTIELAGEAGFTVPKQGFDTEHTFQIGKNKVVCRFFGPGHTEDNVVGYIPAEKLLFGGCLVKSLTSGRGYLGDARVEEWSNTVSGIKQAYPDVQYVIPGHGRHGDISLLNFTIEMFEKDRQ